MKKIIKLLLTISALLLAFSSSRCSKGKENCIDCTDGPRDTLYIEKDFLDYWYAETGSWWVFKRTDTVGIDMYDTMRVKYHERKIKAHHSYGKNAFEQIKMYLAHSDSNFQIPELQNSVAGKFDVMVETINLNINQSIVYSWVHDRDKLFYLPMGEYSMTSMLSLHYPFMLNINDNRTLPYIMENTDSTIKTLYGTLENTLVISDVHGLNVRFYISKNIGISRMEIQGGQVWELVDCNVIRTQ